MKKEYEAVCWPPVIFIIVCLLAVFVWGQLNPQTYATYEEAADLWVEQQWIDPPTDY